MVALPVTSIGADTYREPREAYGTGGEPTRRAWPMTGAGVATMSLDDSVRATLESLRREVEDVLTREVKSVEERLHCAMDHERRVILEQAEQTARAAADLRAVTTATTAKAADHQRTRQDAYDEGFDAGRADGWETGRQHGVLEGRQTATTEAAARELASTERLVDAIRQIETGRTVPEVLEILLKCATHEAARAAILIVRGNELQGWKFIGFGARTDNPTEFRQAILGAGVVEEAIRTGAAASTHGPVRIPAPAFAELPLGRRALSVPIIIQGRVVAALYADQGSQARVPDHPCEGVAWPAALEVMTRHASRCLEASGAMRGTPSSPAAAPSTAGVAR